MNELQMIWGWEPALYLFLGGLGAGTFAAAAVLFLATKAQKTKTLSAAAWASIACLAGGLLLLILELEVPWRGLMLWQSFSHFTSWMTFGAWMAFAALAVFGLTAILSTERLSRLLAKKWKALPEKRDRILKALCIAGIVLGLGVAVYTGLLLMSAPGVPLWNTWLLPCLFTVSALDTGVAAVVVVLAITKEGSHDVSRKLEAAVVVLVLVEIVALICFVLTMLAGNPATAALSLEGAEPTAAMQAEGYALMEGANASMMTLLTGSLAPAFWAVFVGLGLAAPLAAAVWGLRPRAKRAHAAALAGAACALVGGCALRFLVLMAGAHVDFVGNALASLL